MNFIPSSRASLMKKLMLCTICLSIITLTSCALTSRRFGMIFIANLEGQNKTNIYRIPDTTQNMVEQLTTTPSSGIQYFLASPQGDNIVFGTFNPDLVYLLDANNKSVHDITNRFVAPTMGALTYPADWASNQKQFAILSTEEHFLGIMDFNGGDKEYFDLSPTSMFSKVASARWSPDNEKLAFTHLMNTAPSSLQSSVFLYDLASKQLTRLTNYEAGCFDPRWSPKGEQIVVTCQTKGFGSSTIYFLSMADTGQLYKHLDISSCRGSAWSPDGEKLIFVCQQGGGFGLFVFNSDGTGRRQIEIVKSRGLAFLGYPVWSPDGTQIIYVAGEDWQHTNIYSVDLDGSDNRAITHQAANYQGLFVYPIP